MKVSIFYDKNLSLSVTAASGVEAVTKRELQDLGYVPSAAVNGRICFSGDFSDVAKCNVNLRTADRVYVNLGTFSATTFDELFDGVKTIAWENVVEPHGKITVNAKSAASKLFALSAIQSITKKAVCERLKQKGFSSISETGADYRINMNFFKDVCTVSLDTSGAGLHKRGYRMETGEAPIRETLAAAILMLSYWNKNRVLVDPFTGSGTIPIEAALIATDTAPGLKREFLFDTWPNAPKVLSAAKEEAQAKVKEEADLRIRGFDIDGKALKLAVRHAKLAGVDKYVHFQTEDMRNISSRFSHGVMVANPPYGERLMTENEVAALYKDFGKLFFSLDEWSLYAITHTEISKEPSESARTKPANSITADWNAGCSNISARRRKKSSGRIENNGRKRKTTPHRQAETRRKRRHRPRRRRFIQIGIADEKSGQIQKQLQGLLRRRQASHKGRLVKNDKKAEGIFRFFFFILPISDLFC